MDWAELRWACSDAAQTVSRREDFGKYFRYLLSVLKNTQKADNYKKSCDPLEAAGDRTAKKGRSCRFTVDRAPKQAYLFLGRMHFQRK